MPLLDETNSPLSREQAQQLDQLIQQLSPEQLTWLSGFLTGLKVFPQVGAIEPQSAPQPSPAAAASPPAEKPELTILFGSQTGNSEEVAKQAKERAIEWGFDASLKDMGEYKKATLKNEKNLMVVVSTHGEGDPPDNAEEMHEFLHSKKAPKLGHLQYSVLALGDTSYEHFCQSGKDFDQRLEALGGYRLVPRVDCDVDYEEEAERWIEETLSAFAAVTQPAQDQAAHHPVTAPEKAVPVGQASASYSKKNPFPASLLENINLNGRGSSKETRHIELSLEGSGLVFEPGDSLGVFPSNNPEHVSELIETLGLHPEEPVPTPEGEASLEYALTHSYEITTLTPPLVKNYVSFCKSDELQELVKEENKKQLMQYIEGRQLIDLVTEHPVNGIKAADLPGLLRKLSPRLYSIASSHTANPDEVHLTVAAVRYHSRGREREGACSTFLADRVGEDSTIPVYVDSNKNFKLPDDPSTPIIMVGPGTGIAPFRAFLEERELQGAEGPNWLFFGDQRFQTDFLYQIEWLQYLKDGLLTRMDVAFSRDLDRKVYVQHRMLENSYDLYAWLQEGAYFYVCGDANRMAPDVHEALILIAEREGGLNRERAEEYVKSLQREKRYQRDVY